jgi:N-hydroxyarylamine O-acetyltransferase
VSESSIDLDAYLARVGLSAAPGVDENGLRELHDAQFHSIPFENLDIHLGREILLDPESLSKKLVGKLRGGYCFELNGLLLLAMNALGFTARPLLARVHLGDSPTSLTHQISLVSLEGRDWIVDAGFGAGGPRRPYLLKSGRTTEQGNPRTSPPTTVKPHAYASCCTKWTRPLAVGRGRSLASSKTLRISV